MIYDSYFLKLTKYEMLLSGIWPIKNNSKLYIFYKIYGVITKVNFLYFLVTLVLGFLMSMSNLTKTQKADGITFILSYSMSFWKIWLLQSEPIKEIMRKITKLENRIEDDDELYDTYRRNARFNFKLGSIQPILLSASFLTFFFMIIENLILWNKLEAEGLESHRTLMYPQWFPFYQQKWFMGYLVMQLINGFWGGVYMTVSDGLIGSLMYFISTDLIILGIELERFGCNEMDYIDKVNQLKNSILKHKVIISDVEVFNKIFGWVFFLEFTIKSFHITQILFALSEMKQIDLAIIFKVLEFLIVFSQFTVLYYQANCVILESGNLSDSIYKCQWMGQRIELTKSLLIVMIRAGRTLKFEAFGHVILSNALTVKVIHALLSYIVFATVQESTNG